MLCYDVRVSYIEPKTVFDEPADKKSKDEELEEKLRKLNAEIYAMTSDNDFYAVAYKVDDDFINFAVGSWPCKITMSKIKKKIEKAVANICGASNIKIISALEITAKQYTMKIDEANNREYLKRSNHMTEFDLGFDYFGNNYFKINEIMASPDKLTKKKALKRAREMMADQSLIEEIERIYAPENSKKFYGYPVHYRIQAGSRDAGVSIIELMMQMLYSQGRILSSRINLVSDIGECCFDESDLKNLFKHADGAAIVIEMRGSDEDHGNYATSYESVIRYISELVDKYNSNTLFFFLEDVDRTGFSRELISKVTDYMDVIDICEGTGTREDAVIYFRKLIEYHSYSELGDSGIEEYLPKKRKTYRSKDVHDAFNRWSREVLRNKVYSSYAKCKNIEIQEHKKGSAYAELQNMVGLSEVKRITDQIIASYKLQSIRENYGFKDCSISKHMVFTGNPGSAKTTVARLLADILTEEGVLKTGALVECGRADLVGKYVGWTAQKVRDKFKAAKGGILFIDEAYSLVDDSKTFGDEAINTIVQEMENHRSKVIVIFAGYPEKMKAFLDQNEGLRSRIAFHLDFPDYNEDELLSILEFMAKERGLKLDDKAKEKCFEIFKEACKEEEFGNGRFARNLIEQAMLKQAQRLMSGKKGKKIQKASVERLVADDFDVNISETLYAKKSNTIGFAV